MSNKSGYGDTILLQDFQPTSEAKALARVHFVNGSDGAHYDERWLQNLIMQHPGLLPVTHLEPTFSDMVPVCSELRMRAGSLDNLFITPNGDIAVVECKLWRNPEARRKVLAQIIDYASELSNWNYNTLEESVKNARSNIEGDKSQRSLYDIVSAVADIDEVSFHDAVSRNLKRGRLLLLIVGDGIQEGLETMAEFLQTHAGLHFHLALVELALFEVPGTGYIAQPRILARTKTIERFVFTLNESRTDVPPSVTTLQPQPPRATTMSQEQFLEDLKRHSPTVVPQLLSFLENISRYNVLPVYGTKTLTLRWHREDARDWNLGTIINSGGVWMDYHAVQARNLNVVDQSKKYLESLAELLPGASVNRTKSGQGWNISGADGHAPQIEDLLADHDRASGWERAIEQFEAALEKLSEDE